MASITLTSTPSSSHGSLQLSPPKKRKRPPQLLQPFSSSPAASSSGHSAEDLWKWTFRKDAVAKCRIRDVLNMEAYSERGSSCDKDFYWLGRIPCRVVEIVGIVVGLSVWEKKTAYSVDDGSAVIDCWLTHPPQTPKKTDKAKDKLPTLPVPIVKIGDLFKVTGKIEKYHETRRLSATAISRCKSSNDEPKHWQSVKHLHETYYSLSEPFIIPSLQEDSTEQVEPSSSSHLTAQGTTTDPVTPSRSRINSTLPTPSTSAYLSSRPSSPAKSNVHLSPAKLRHPSKLRSRDLNNNTFRIYLKHYMDNAPPIMDHEATVEDVTATPTQSRRDLPSATPRPTSRNVEGIRTSRLDHSCTSRSTSYTMSWGFTLSYLLRVPELALMAQQMVKTEAKRLARKEREQLGASSRSLTSTSQSKYVSLPPDAVARKAKRLFKITLQKLLSEGSVVLWDGPTRPLHFASLSQSAPGIIGDASHLWRSTANTSLVLETSTTSIFSEGISEINDEYFLSGLSDPQPNEDAYLPINAVTFSSHVERAMTEIAAHGLARATAAAKRIKLNLPPSPPPGPTPEEILKWMKRDSRWENVGVWNVEEALKVLSEDGKVYSIGEGRWESCQ